MERLNISTSDEKKQYNNENFLINLKEALSDFDGISVKYVIERVQSEEFKTRRELIEKSFWDFFDCISKDDDSLEACLYLQKYGFKISRPVKDDLIVLLDSDEED